MVISHGFDVVFQDLTFTNVQVGINATAGGNGNVGSYALVDSVAKNVNIVVATKEQNATTSGDDSVIIDNLQTFNVQNTVVAGTKTILKGSVPKTWVYGNAYLKKGPVQGVHDYGVTYQTSRSPALLGSNGAYFVAAPPTYQEYSVKQVVNIKNVKGFPVYGDGQTVSPILYSNVVVLLHIMASNITGRMIPTTSTPFSAGMLVLPSHSSPKELILCLILSLFLLDLALWVKPILQSVPSVHDSPTPTLQHP